MGSARWRRGSSPTFTVMDLGSDVRRNPEDFGHHPQRLRDTDRSRHRLLCPRTSPEAEADCGNIHYARREDAEVSQGQAGLSQGNRLGEAIPFLRASCPTPRTTGSTSPTADFDEPDTDWPTDKPSLAKSPDDGTGGVWSLFVGCQSPTATNGFTTSIPATWSR